jgi:hypothetical protein
MMASKSSGCGCGDKMQEGGPVTSMQTAKGSMMALQLL